MKEDTAFSIFVVVMCAVLLAMGACMIRVAFWPNVPTTSVVDVTYGERGK